MLKSCEAVYKMSVVTRQLRQGEVELTYELRMRARSKILHINDGRALSP